MRADRLLRLLHLLQRHGTLPASRLAVLLEVSERTVLRDMDALSAAGVPVYTQRGRGGGCSLVEGYRTDLSGLTSGEVQALFLRDSSNDATTELGLGPELGNALAKLAASVPRAAMDGADALASTMVVDRRRWFAAAEEVPLLPLLRQEVAAGRRLRLRYGSAAGEPPSSRTVDPYGLVENAGRWYLLAAHRGVRRTYRVSRIVDVVGLDEPARRPAGLDLAHEWAESRRALEVGDSIDLEVAVEPAVVETFRRLVAFQAAPGTTPLELAPAPGDDRVRLHLTLRARRQAVGLLLTFGGSVELVAPPDLRAELVATARTALAVHDG